MDRELGERTTMGERKSTKPGSDAVPRRPERTDPLQATIPAADRTPVAEPLETEKARPSVGRPSKPADIRRRRPADPCPRTAGASRD